LLNRKGITVADKGTNAADSVITQICSAVAEDVARKRADLGILVCGTGIGLSSALIRLLAFVPPRIAPSMKPR